MSVTAAASGFVFILLSLPVVQVYDDWGVTYKPSKICAVKGSSVTIRCSYTYPAKINGVTIVVNQNVWFTEQSDDEPDDLTTDSLYVGRVSSDFDSYWKSCSLTITDLRESDSAEYKFRFITNQPKGRWTGSPGVTLSVAALQVHVVPSGYNWKTLSCQSSCELNNNPSYIWYKNGQREYMDRYSYSREINPPDSYSCAVHGLDHSTSPSMCLHGGSCNRVNYSNRSICAFKGSSVDISCTYNSYNNPIQSKFWFDVRQSHYSSKDLSEDSRYAGRVQVLETERGRSTLRISDLTDADSADYRFKFKTQRFEWGSSLPGTTLTVTEISIRRNGQKLYCMTSCQPYVSSYVWYKNGQEVSGGSSYLEEVSYDNINSYSCALKGYEDFHSALVCRNGQNCNKVTYTNRRICAIKGSSVDISCTYNHYSSSSNFQSKFWFRTDRRYQWQNTSQPEDLIQDSRYERRVQVHETVSRSSTLTIRDLRESDSAEYRFKFKTPTFEWRSSLPGTTLTVTALWVQVTRRDVLQSSTKAELKCLSSCSPAGRPSIVWFKNEERTPGKASYEGVFNTGDNISCAFIGHEGYRSPSVYAPRAASAVMSPSGVIMEGSLVNLTCSSDANPAANYTWYKEQTQLSKEPQLVFRSIQSNQSGEYYCTAENELGKKTSENILLQVKYAPKLPSVTARPSGEIVEGGSVTLTCHSDANPAAKYSWYKENQTLSKALGGERAFLSVSPEDTGKYYCTSENLYGQTNSSSLLIDVQYAPKNPTVSLSPSGEIVEGGAVNLTCESDANPAAKYSWYKENDATPKSSEQIFTINYFRPEHSGHYYCEAKNTRGHKNSTLHLIILASSVKAAAVGSISVIFVIIVFLSLFLFIRRKRSSKQTSESRERSHNIAQQHVGPEEDKPSAAAQKKLAVQQDDLHYVSVRFRKDQDDPIYSNVMLPQPNRNNNELEEEEDTVYTVVNLTSVTPGLRRQESVEDMSALYSTVSKNLSMNTT